MSSHALTIQDVRENAQRLLQSIGVRRIVVVDDEYASENLSVEDLMGIIEEITLETAVTIPMLANLSLEAGLGIWEDELRKLWDGLDIEKRADVLRQARSLQVDSNAADEFEVDDDSQTDTSEAETAQSMEEKVEPIIDAEGEHELEAEGIGAPVSAATDPQVVDGVVPEPIVPGQQVESDGAPELDATGTPKPSAPKGDAIAALGLAQLLDNLTDITLETLSLSQWRNDCDRYFSSGDEASHTLFLFDRNFERESGSPDEGLKLVRNVQVKGASLCGLITSTVPIRAEHNAWDSLSREYDLDRDRFLVISKQRLTTESIEIHYSFLRMLRLVVLNGRCGDLKKAAWEVFEDSMVAAKEAMENVSVLDFDQIVLASSLREGVWEPDTLFRIFSVFMRREARRRMHEGGVADIPAKVRAARAISVIHVDINGEYEIEPPCQGAIQVHRFELYEWPEFLNRHHIPIDIGDLFEGENGRRYILLSQPCDLMVRPKSGRAYDNKCTRQVVLAEILINEENKHPKMSWERIDWYDDASGAPAYVDFALAHETRLAVLDLCVLNVDGTATFNSNESVPEDLADSWQVHFSRVQKVFKNALACYKKLGEKSVPDDLKKLLLPAASLTAKFDSRVEGDIVSYELKRIGRLLQPRAGAILTRFAQFRSRAAFDHDLDHRTPQKRVGGGVTKNGSDYSGDSAGRADDRNGD